MSNDLPKVKNYMETLVYDALDGILDKMDMCKCEKCKLDVIAIALNALPPKYVATENGMFYTKLQLLQEQFNVNVFTAIANAAVIVKGIPRHEN